jgi:hypothetical protein
VLAQLGAPISLKNKQRRTQAHLLSSGAFPPRPPSHTRHAPPPACAADQLAPLSPAPAHCGIDDQGFPCGVLHTVWYASGGVLSEQSRCTRVCPFRELRCTAWAPGPPRMGGSDAERPELMVHTPRLRYQAAAIRFGRPSIRGCPGGTQGHPSFNRCGEPVRTQRLTYLHPAPSTPCHLFFVAKVSKVSPLLEDRGELGGTSHPFRRSLPEVEHGAHFLILH